MAACLAGGAAVAVGQNGHAKAVVRSGDQVRAATFITGCLPVERGLECVDLAGEPALGVLRAERAQVHARFEPATSVTMLVEHGARDIGKRTFHDDGRTRVTFRLPRAARSKDVLRLFVRYAEGGNALFRIRLSIPSRR